MNNLKNKYLIDALNLKKTDKTPVWIMRQAGRYLPEYRKIRAEQKNFLSMCKNPELACEITMLPINRYPLDAAIIFSDILTIPNAMGMDLDFIENKGPVFNSVINSQKSLDDLININPEEHLNYALQAIKLVKQELNNKIPLIGFTGSPFTVATYMVEGQTSKSFTKIKSMLYKNPDLLKNLLQKLAKNIADFLIKQIDAGTDTVMIFDSWGGILRKEDYFNFSLSYMKEIIINVKKIHPHVPIIVFTKNGGKYLQNIIETNCDCIGLDWTIELDQAKNMVGNKVALQGNMDPCILYAPPKTIKKEVTNILNKFNNQTGHIFNLGHGINPDTPTDSVSAMLDAINNYNPIS